jgi:hypothetical protein
VVAGQLDNILGSDLRALEIAESIDQIFSALVGQLLSQVMGLAGGLADAGKSSSSGSANAYNQSLIKKLNGQKTNISNIPIVGSCTPNRQRAEIGEAVTWSAYIPTLTGNVTYTWYGDGGLMGSSSSATMIYTTAGMKAASVIVSTSGKDADTQQIDCFPDVQIGNLTTSASAPTIICGVTPNQVSVNTPVTWQVTATGGVQPLIYTWAGSDGLSGTGASKIKSYSSPGTKTATVNVISDGNTYSHVCTDTVTVI